MIPVRVYVLVNLFAALSYQLLELAVIHAEDCVLLKEVAEDRRKERWTLLLDLLALAASFIPGVHYISCPLLVAAVAPWIIPDLRMKKVIEKKNQAASQRS